MKERIPYDEIISIIRSVEHGYLEMTDGEIIEQLDAIYSCNYVFEKKGRFVGFRNTKTKLNLKISGLHYYSPDSIIQTYKNVWSKSSIGEHLYKETRVKTIKAFFLALFSLFLLFFDSVNFDYIVCVLFMRIIYFMVLQEYYRRKSKTLL
tara:strand:+ start:1754 stop:2203 length:450 start_codon:yes stop_codon:yes gene_type:complete